MTFGKPGRPPEDRLLRQREIFEAVAPLIVSRGVRQLSMREAAHAACLSIGGLYHYFPTKRDLVLHGLDAGARGRICAEQHARLRGTGQVQPEEYVDICVDTSLRLIGLMRPAVLAAHGLGEPLQTTLDAGWTSDVGELATGLRAMFPNLSSAETSSLARLIRRVMIGAVVERELDVESTRADLRGLITRHVWMS